MTRPAERRALTVEDLYVMPDDGMHHEIQRGVLVSEPLPGFRHGRTSVRLTVLIERHVQAHGLGAVLGNDTGFVLARSPDTVRGPDIAFVRRGRFEGLTDPAKAFPGPPDLAVEVLSPSNTPSSVQAKVADYLEAGTRLVWIVDPEQRCVTVHRSLVAPRVLGVGDVLDGQDVLPELRIPVADLFEA